MDSTFPTMAGKLGFGLMRLPRSAGRIDIGQVSDMVDEFLGAGFNYFDTARIYPGSEVAAHRALVKRYPRDRYVIATKLNTMVAPTAGLAKRQLETSLRKLGCGYVDFYLLHSLMGATYKSYERLGLWDYVRDLKQQGKVRHVGFSFHGGPDLLDKLLTEHPETEFVQLQINYADWENDRITSRANYEVARAHSKPIVVMEPVKGGALANPAPEVRKVFDDYATGASYASWALRFAASLDGVCMVLSGMSDMAQIRDNISFMRDFAPLSAAELEVVRQARDILGASSDIPCTACGYCLAGCPKRIAIPDVFAAMNIHLAGGQVAQAQQAYQAAAVKGADASACIACGACESACPQHISIVSQLRECASTLST